MARYDHLPIYRAAFDLAVHIEKIVHNMCVTVRAYAICATIN
jgi:hypothetical protein